MSRESFKYVVVFIQVGHLRENGPNVQELWTRLTAFETYSSRNIHFQVETILSTILTFDVDELIEELRLWIYVRCCEFSLVKICL